MLEGVIPNHKEMMALGSPQVAVHDDQPSSINPNNDEKYTFTTHCSHGSRKYSRGGKLNMDN